ncbi:MAG: putative CRISPR-associated protein [Thermoguttaceae bacterium]|nr:putative CRISPR-associated protein [Thermoguttaceae bacterium]MDW8037624.1 putative CRISPR-associated protein [Thermoguttaceae bacterium]
MRKILCTTGISIAEKAKQAAGEQKPLEQARAAIQKSIEICRQSTATTEEFLTRLSAETHSLLKLRLSKNEEVVLLHTETEEGRLCAEAVQQVLEEELGVCCRLVQIEGLQVHDAERFRRVGIQKLFETLCKETERAPENPDQKVILNATGGFKSVVPYLTLFGLLHRLEVVYIFERSPVLLRLPPVPINFDYERLSQAEKALAVLQQEGVMSKERFFGLIPGLRYEDRSWYEALLEEDERGYVTLSAFGNLLASSLEREQSQVFLSPEARRTYEGGSRPEQEVWNLLLSKVADPLWRRAHRHSFHQTDLEVYKPDRTPHRLAGFLQGNRIYVCLLYAKHHEYERDLPKRRKAEWTDRLPEFRPWYPPVEEKSPGREEELFDRYQEALKKAEQESNETAKLWQEAEQEKTRLTEENRQLKNQLQQLQTQWEQERCLWEEEKKTWEAQKRDLETQLEHLHRQLAQA